ncbi:MAG TPA: hydrogenase maturation protease [Candidatus Limnocylindrales bacterium]|nr:hydrogenase maturation protease [Candidatus Limnocylindrales bacterium]
MTRRPGAMAVREPVAFHRPPRAARQFNTEVLVCGSRDRGDDGAPIAAAESLPSRLPADARVRIVGQLDIDDLLAVPAGARVVIVDAAIGIRPGRIVELPLTGFIGRTDRLRPRSSHSLAFKEVIGLAELMRGHPLQGVIVAIGGRRFGLGDDLSEPVARAVPALVDSIVNAVDEGRG